MTEAEWDACADPQPMLKFLRGKATERKSRLFACACCRSIWHLLTETRGRDAVEVAERYADGLASDGELAKARRNAQDAWTTLNKAQPEAYKRSRDAGEAGCILIAAIDAAGSSTDKDAFAGACSASTCAAHAAGHQAASRGAPATYDTPAIYVREELAGRQKQYAYHSQLLHDIFGNPFRFVSISLSWLAWNGGAICKMAQAIYDDRTFDRLPLLADALEDAGCADADILAHCRQLGVHVRGCWVVDLLLGKT